MVDVLTLNVLLPVLQHLSPLQPPPAATAAAAAATQVVQAEDERHQQRQAHQRHQHLRQRGGGHPSRSGPDGDHFINNTVSHMEVRCVLQF